MQPYINFKSVKATPINLKEVMLEWSLDLTSAPLGNYRFRVLRNAGAEKGPFETVVDNLSTNTTSYSDKSINIASKFKSPSWWIEIYDTTSSFVRRTEELYIGESYDKIALTMIDKAHMLLHNKQKGVGIDCVLHPLKSWGERCPTCWDAVKQKMKISNCPDCFGSGFKNGYFNPIPFKMSIDAGRINYQLADQTAVETARYQGWTVAGPGISVNDVITCINTNTRYRVINVAFSVKRGAALRQFVSLTMLTRGSVEYKLPVK